jgi:hypothetical protein
MSLLKDKKMKIVDMIRNGNPENPVYGYGDSCAVIESGNQLFLGPCSTEPVGQRHVDGMSWIDCMAEMAEGEYKIECIDWKDKFGKCLLINNNRYCPTTNPNHNHEGQYIANGLRVHSGADEGGQDNRGSKACPTIPRDRWAEFIGLWTIGEIGKLIIRKKQ